MAAAEKPDLAQYRDRMDKAVAALKEEFGGLRTGRATAGLLDQVMVEAYGSHDADQPGRPRSACPSRARSPSASGTRRWWSSVEKAIRNAGLGLNPVVEGQNLRMPIPPLTEERRKDLAKLAGKYAEQQRIAVRNVRRDANDDLKKAEKDGVITQDELKRHGDRGPEAHRRGDQARRRGLENQRARDHAGLSVARVAARRAEERPRRMSRRRWPERARAAADVGPGGAARRCTWPSSWTATAAGRRQRGLPRTLGHRAGVDGAEAHRRGRAGRSGVERLTVFGFSTENWRRPRARGLRTDGPAEGLCRQRPGPAGARGRAGAHHRPPRRPDARHPGDHRAGRGAHGRTTTASTCRSPSTTAAGPTSPTPRARFAEAVARGHGSTRRPRRGGVRAAAVHRRRRRRRT